jgi:transposase-like protein
MGEHLRKADGRRVFSTEFKRETVQRIVTGEKTVAELSRELDIAPSVIRNWKRFAEAGATTAVQASEDVVPASQLREAYAKIRDLFANLPAYTTNYRPDLIDACVIKESYRQWMEWRSRVSRDAWVIF